MKFRKVLCALILALFSLQTLNFTALADEGMWTFNNVPRAEIKKIFLRALDFIIGEILNPDVDFVEDDVTKIF